MADLIRIRESVNSAWGVKTFTGKTYVVPHQTTIGNEPAEILFGDRNIIVTAKNSREKIYFFRNRLGASHRPALSFRNFFAEFFKFDIDKSCSRIYNNV